MSLPPLYRPMARRLRCATALVALVALGSATLTPLSAQVTPAPEDVPIIDLGPVLGALPGSTETPPSDATALETADPAPPGTVITVPEDQLTVPQYERGAASQVPPEARSDALLLPLRAERPTLDGIIRLSGEVERAGFFVDLPVGAIASDLVISYRIAINVLPEQSELRITVNGTEIAPVRPVAFEGFAPISLPAELLTTGRNQITVEARQAHRIFCGPEATFAVWTEIDTNTSGARVGLQDLGLDPSGLALAFRAQLALSGTLPVRLSRPEDAEILGGFSTRMAALRDGGPVVLRPEPVFGANADIPDRARITVLSEGPPLAEVRRGADGAVVLVLGGAETGLLPDLEALLPLPAPLVGNPVLTPGTVIPLGTLMEGPLETYNRYAELPVLFQMPEDWLTLASQKALLRLAYGFADGLPRGALMLVKVNDTTVRLLPLDRNANEARPLLDVGFPARLLRPGVNALTFVAIVPGDPVDLPCPPIGAPLLTIDLNSTLEVPPSPRMTAPGMGGPLRALRPDQITPPSSELPFTLDQRNTLAVLSSALRPILGTERITDANLTVTTLADAPALPLGGLDMTRRDLDRVLAEPATVDPNADPAPLVVEDTGLDLMGRLWSAGLWVRQLAMPGDPPLSSWLSQRRGQAVLLTPDPDVPGDLWLVLGAQADPLTVAPLLAQARVQPHGPTGQVAILGNDGRWQSWHDKSMPPMLHEPLSLRNVREVAGNYASWSPLYFGLVLFGLTFVSVGLALAFVVTTRGRRKKR